MKHVRSYSFALPSVGLWIEPDEWERLQGLPMLCLALFCHLVARSNFKTGAGTTGYGELLNALTPDQPERGRRFEVPSRETVKRSIRRLEEVHLLRVDRLHSEQVQTINFLVQPRARRGVPKGKSDRVCDPGPHEGKRGTSDPGLRPGLSTVRNSSPTPCGEQLSTVPLAVTEALQKVKARLGAGGRTRAPEGA